MTATTLPRNPVTIQAEIDQLCPAFNNAQTAYRMATSDCLEENGICMRCRGKGTLLETHWEDGMGDIFRHYTPQVVKCTACDGRDDSAKVEELLADFHGEYERLSNEINALDTELDKSNRIEANPKGYRVRVTAKRAKVKHGTEGLCFWIGDSQYGTRIGIKTDAGETIWTALDNVSPVWEA